jgi:hypothetical protein
MTQEEHRMSNENAQLIRRAYQAYANGDLPGMLELVDPGLEWTYLDPALEHPTPQVCHGRQELEQALRHWAEHGRRDELGHVGLGQISVGGVGRPAGGVGGLGVAGLQRLHGQVPDAHGVGGSLPHQLLRCPPCRRRHLGPAHVRS